MPFLEIRNISKAFNTVSVLKKIDLTVNNSEFFSLVGPSGCGKTTLLRIIAGLETPTSGSILLNGKDITSLPPQKRNIGIVFQNYALFPHMTVFQNVSYGLEIKKLSKPEIAKKVNEVLEKVKLAHKAEQSVTKLSGGEQQRVSLARVIVTEPQLILFDEPLSNLDYALRIETRTEIKRLQKEIGITSIYVTHDQSEALALSDRITVMNKGVVQQMGTPEEIYFSPSNLFTAEFIGHANFFNAEESRKIFNISELKAGEKLAVLPEELLILSPGELEVADIQFNGYSVEYLIRGGEKLVRALSASTIDGVETGSKVSLKLSENYKKRILSE